MFDATRKSPHQENSTSSGLTRRQMVKASAWAAPVLAVAVATPSAAATTAPPAVTPGVPAVQPGTGDQKKVVNISVGATANVSSVTAIITVTPPNVKNPGTWSNGQSGTVAQSVTDGSSPFNFTFPTFTKPSANDAFSFSIQFYSTDDLNTSIGSTGGTF